MCHYSHSSVLCIFPARKLSVFFLNITRPDTRVRDVFVLYITRNHSQVKHRGYYRVHMHLQQRWVVYYVTPKNTRIRKKKQQSERISFINTIYKNVCLKRLYIMRCLQKQTSGLCLVSVAVYKLVLRAVHI